MSAEASVKIRELLLTEERSTIALMQSLGHDIDLLVHARQDANTDDEHDPEGPTIAFERAQTDALLQQSQARLDDISAAIRRLDAGTYGVCETCGKRIPHARLTARPYARECIHCASA